MIEVKSGMETDFQIAVRRLRWKWRNQGAIKIDTHVTDGG